MPNQFAPWEQYEYDFLRETYPLPEWSAKKIADKLDRTPHAVSNQANKMKIMRPRQRMDYQAIKALRDAGINANQIAKRLGVTPPAVRYAFKALDNKKDSLA